MRGQTLDHVLNLEEVGWGSYTLMAQNTNFKSVGHPMESEWSRHNHQNHRLIWVLTVWSSISFWLSCQGRWLNTPSRSLYCWLHPYDLPCNPPFPHFRWSNLQVSYWSPYFLPYLHHIPTLMVQSIPARDPKQCGGSGRIMYDDVDDDGDDDGGDDDDGDENVTDDDVEDDNVAEEEVEEDDVWKMRCRMVMLRKMRWMMMMLRMMSRGGRRWCWERWCWGWGRRWCWGWWGAGWWCCGRCVKGRTMMMIRMMLLRRRRRWCWGWWCWGWWGAGWWCCGRWGGGWWCI